MGASRGRSRRSWSRIRRTPSPRATTSTHSERFRPCRLASARASHRRRSLNAVRRSRSAPARAAA